MQQILAVLIAFQLWIPAASFAAATATVVVFGDSTTAPRGELPVYAKLLDEHFQQAGINAQVINSGVGGDHTERARARFDRDVLQHDPQLVVIQFGINDAAVDVWQTPPATEPRVSQAVYAANLRYFVRTLRRRGASPILMTPNPLRWTPKLRELYGKQPYDAESVEGFNVLLAQYAETCRQVAQQEHVQLIDVDQVFRKTDVESLLLDGMHPNAAGQKLVFETLRPTLLKSLAEVESSASDESDGSGNSETAADQEQDKSNAGSDEPAWIAHQLGVPNVCAWPNLTVLPDGTITAVIFNRPSHGQESGDVECWASRDGVQWEKRGQVTEHEPGTVRMNAAAGLAANGDLIVVCSGWTDHKQPGWPKQAAFRDAVIGAWVCRSSDGGRTWTTNREFAESESDWTEHIPFGDIVAATDGSLRMCTYQGHLTPNKTGRKMDRWRSWMFRSDDDGRTWKKLSLLGQRHNETTAFPLGGTEWLAAARIDAMELIRSTDDGRSWAEPVRVTRRNEINGHLMRTQDGRLVLTYGNRITGECGVLARLSSDDGRTWSEPLRLAHSHERDCGYPSTVQTADGRLVTAWYSKSSPLSDTYHMGVTLWMPPAVEDRSAK